jgi:hypothetical protein
VAADRCFEPLCHAARRALGHAISSASTASSGFA